MNGKILEFSCAMVALASCNITFVDFTVPVAENCSLAGDEDGNGAAGCDDSACAQAPACSEDHPLCDTAANPFGGGSGTLGDPFLLCSPAHINQVSAVSGETSDVKHFALASDVDMVGVSFVPIASLVGSLDGRRHRLKNIAGASSAINQLHGTIKDLIFEDAVFSGSAAYMAPIGNMDAIGPALVENVQSLRPSITSTGSFAAGLVAFMEAGAIVRNSMAVNVSVNHPSQDATGGLVGFADGAGVTIEGSWSSGAVTAGVGNFHGGLVGYLVRGATVQRSFSSAVVKVAGAGQTAGGLVGAVDTGGQVLQSHSIGSVEGSYRVGGLVGMVANGGYVRDSYSRARVTVRSTSPGTIAGGLIGDVYLNGGGLISRCWSAGIVEGAGTQKGGMIGVANGPVADSYWDIVVSGQTTSGGGIGKTTLDMQEPGTFVGWGTPPWVLIQGAYPKLAWEP